MYTSPKRFKYNFSTLEGAETFADQKRQGGAKDVSVVPRDSGADVAWTEYTSD
jgi:hypothetical protein